MMFLLPAGIMDGILAGSALILILMEYFGDTKAIDQTAKFLLIARYSSYK
jgi:hypothetical protein